MAEPSSERFDSHAAKWDEKPGVKQLALYVGSVLKRICGLEKSMKVLDFGSGTGLISFAIADVVEKVVAVDKSEGMCNVMKKKIEDGNTANVECRLLLLDNLSRMNGEKYDVVFSSMTFHHLADVPKTMKILGDLVAENGHLVIIDIAKSEYSHLFHIHKHHDIVHEGGFTSEELEQWMKEAGMNSYDKEYYSQNRKGRDGVVREYSLIFAHGRK